MKKTLALATALCILANGCYFNPSAYIFSQAEYKASANSADTQIGQSVYSYRGEYFVELPRYRQNKEIRLQRIIFEDDPAPGDHLPTKETSMMRIPEDFAMYLTGRAEAPTTPMYMIPAEDDPDAVKTGERIAITNRGESYSHEFDYRSPYAAWWYTLGGIGWICVDLPISTIENALTLGIIGISLMPRKRR